MTARVSNHRDMSTLRSWAPTRRTVAAVAMAPLSSILVSRLLATGIGAAGLGRVLPSGVHTYEPAVNLLGLNALALLSVAPALLGLRLLAPGRGPTGGGLRALVKLATTLVIAQLAFYGIQALVVSQVQGIPDSSAAAAIGIALEAAVVLAALAAAGTVGLLLPCARLEVALLGAALGSALPLTPQVAAVLVPVPLGISRRGPPRPLPHP